MLRLIRSAFGVAVTVTSVYATVGQVSAAIAANKPCLRHFVAFKFIDSASPAQIDSVASAFRNLKKSIPQVQSIEDGPNNSPENLNKGLTHAFLVTFAGEKERDIYLTHAAHEKFKTVALPLVEDVMVFDFYGKKPSFAGKK